MRKYRQLTYEDRIYIEVWIWERRSLKFMAERLGVHPSTISREKRRGGTGELKIGYMGHLGEGYRRQTDKRRGRKPKLTGELMDGALSRSVVGSSEKVKKELATRQSIVF